jgi:hypothetical protein
MLQAGSARCGQSQVIFDTPHGALSLRSADMRGGIYGRARDTAAWHVGQWENPSGDLPDFTGGRAANASLSVTIAPGGDAIAIHQSGRTLVCGEGTVREFDGLIGTNARGNDPGLPAAERIDLRRGSLADYASLRQQVSLGVKAAALIATPQSCPVAKAVSVLCVVFTNQTRATSLFLQTILFAFNTRPHAVWWARGQHNGRFGYNLLVPDAAELRPGGPSRRFDIDILPDIRRLLAHAPNGLDPDLRDWHVSGAYFGNAVYGGVEVATAWSGYRLVADF